MTLFLNAAYASSAVTLESANPQHTGLFGNSVAISGTMAVVGAPFEDGDGDSQAGHAFIIDTTANALPITLTSPNTEGAGSFGQSVAISGTSVVVGAAGGSGGAGNAYVFDAASDSLITTLTSPNTAGGRAFGQSVTISGTTVVVGAPEEDVLVFPIAVFPYAGHAYVFDTSSGSPPSTLTNPNAQTNGAFGASVAISCDTTVVVGAPMETAGAGHAYVFDATTGAIATLTSPYAQEIGDFGRSVAINEGDPTVVVGAPMETASGQFVAGHAYLFLI